MTRQPKNEAFARTSFLHGANAHYIEEMQAQYEKNPGSVSDEWRHFFASLQEEQGGTRAEGSGNGPGPSWARPLEQVEGRPARALAFHDEEQAPGLVSGLVAVGRDEGRLVIERVDEQAARLGIAGRQAQGLARGGHGAVAVGLGGGGVRRARGELELERGQVAPRDLQAADIGPLPVCDGDHLVGIVTDRDITVRAVAAGRDPSSTPVRDVMTSDVVYVRDDQDVDEAIELMRRYEVRRLPVVDGGRLAGMVALADLARKTDEQRQAAALEGVSQVSETETDVP